MACAIVAVAGLTSCERPPAAAPPAGTAAPAAVASAGHAGNTVPHGDHNPHHGGVVMMKGDLHYELVLDPDGRVHRVYFTDAVRDELPAALASEVVLTIRRQSQPEERIVMQIDDTGESWIGRGQPVGSPATTTVRLAFTIQREPYWIDLPFSSSQTLLQERQGRGLRRWPRAGSGERWRGASVSSRIQLTSEALRRFPSGLPSAVIDYRVNEVTRD